MSELFGAPVGLLARESQDNQTLTAQTLALQRLGDMSKLPAEKALLEAQARHARALAGAKESDNRDEALMGEFEREAIRLMPALQGRQADVGDMPNSAADLSVTAPLRRLYNVMEARGAPARMIAPIAKQIAEITEKESQTAFNAGRADNELLESRKRNAEWLGSTLKPAIDTPQGYAQLKMMLADRATQIPPKLREFLSQLPPSWEQGKRMLEPIAQSAMSVKEQSELAIRKKEAESKLLTDETTRARNTASAASAYARADATKARAELIKKVGGEGTPEQIAAAETLQESRYRAMEAGQLKRSPYVPLEASKVKEGSTYTLKDGREGRAIKQTDGSIAFDLVTGTKPWTKRTAPRTIEEVRKARKAALADTRSDDGEED